LKRPQGILYLNLDFNFLRLVHSRRKLDSRYLHRWCFDSWTDRGTAQTGRRNLVAIFFP
jgi:hypothetical protein